MGVRVRARLAHTQEHPYRLQRIRAHAVRHDAPPVGQMLYDLKYGGKTTTEATARKRLGRHRSALRPGHVARTGSTRSCPSPPSNNRLVQPVLLVAPGYRGTAWHPRVSANCIAKVKPTPQLKDIKDYDKRREVLKDAFKADPGTLRWQEPLAVRRSARLKGATLGHMVEVLKA